MSKDNSRKRGSRHLRPDTPRPMRLTDRDRAVVKAVNDFRVMRQDQVQRLLFPSRNTAQDRLRRLWEHGYLKRLWLPSTGGIQTSPILYALDRRGADLLKREFGYDQSRLRWSPRKAPSHTFLEHTLGLSEIRLGVHLACQPDDYALGEWQDEKGIKADFDRVQVSRQWVAVVPDAYFVVAVPQGNLHFFLEYDRGSETLRTFRKKVAAYHAYCRDPRCKTRFGTTRIRVLTVIEGESTGPGQGRLANLRQVAEEAEGGRRFWFTTLDQVAARDFLTDPLWQVATRPERASLIA